MFSDKKFSTLSQRLSQVNVAGTHFLVSLGEQNILLLYIKNDS